MKFESPFGFKKSVPESASVSEPESEEYQAVSSSGMEQVIPSSDSLEHLFDDDVQLVSFAENDLAPDTSRDSNEEMDFEPSTLRSRELSSGIRSKADEEFDSTGVQVDEILDPGQESSKYEISAQGTIKTQGDRNLPPFVASSLDPDSERGIGSKHGRKAA